LEQSIVEIGLVLVRHDTHEAHQRPATRAMGRTDRERLGLRNCGCHIVLPQRLPTRELWRQMAVLRDGKMQQLSGRSAGPSI
jgi:hypothetical protein